MDKAKHMTLAAQVSIERQWRARVPCHYFRLGAGGDGLAMCSEEVPMSSDLLDSVKSREGDMAGRSGRWLLPPEPAAESDLPEGSGLLWHLQSELPSRRWYVDAVRGAGQ